MTQETPKKAVGFALMSREQKRDIASLGGRAAHQSGRAYQWTSEKAREAALKGAETRRKKKLQQL